MGSLLSLTSFLLYSKDTQPTETSVPVAKNKEIGSDPENTDSQPKRPFQSPKTKESDLEKDLT